MTSSPWLAAAIALLGAGVGPAVWGVATGPVRRRVVAQNMATLLVCLSFLLLSQGYERTSYVDLALVIAVLGPAGTLVYARLLAEELEKDPPTARATTVTTWTAAALTALVVLPLCVATGPGRATAKLVVIGALLVAGNVIAARTLSGRLPGASGRG